MFTRVLPQQNRQATQARMLATIARDGGEIDDSNFVSWIPIDKQIYTAHKLNGTGTEFKVTTVLQWQRQRQRQRKRYNPCNGGPYM